MLAVGGVQEEPGENHRHDAQAQEEAGVERGAVAHRGEDNAHAEVPQERYQGQDDEQEPAGGVHLGDALPGSLGIGSKNDDIARSDQVSR